MNRTIKFRGKHKTTGEWVYGDLEHLPNNNIHIFGNHASQPVTIESVGQFTGLLDRNSKEIYEGDIITLRGKYPRVILWDKASWAITPCEHYNDSLFWVMNLQHPGNDWWEEFADKIEVVGNIYDNPKLINR